MNKIYVCLIREYEKVEVGRVVTTSDWLIFETERALIEGYDSLIEAEGFVFVSKIPYMEEKFDLDRYKGAFCIIDSGRVLSEQEILDLKDDYRLGDKETVEEREEFDVILKKKID